MNLVVDCSFIMSSVLPDETQVVVDRIYQQISDKIYNVFVPGIFYLECNNVLISSLKKNRISKADYDEYLQLLSALPVEIDKFCSTNESLYSISKLAIIHNLTSYDAAYLELAIRTNAKVATLDRNLEMACKKADLELLATL